MKNLACLLPVVFVAACTVGPDYKGSLATPSDLGARFARAKGDSFSSAAGLSRWWEDFGDPPLNQLVRDALIHNPDIDGAQARIREAMAVFRSRQVDRMPSLGSRATLIHADVPGLDLNGSGATSDSSTSIDLYNLGLNASWEPDLFGGGRRQLEESRAMLDARRADLADTQVSLSAQVAQAYINLRASQEREKLNVLLIALQERTLVLMQQRFEGGTSTRLDVERLQQQLEKTKADAQPLRADIDAYLDQLAILTGRTPGVLDAQLSAVAPIPLPPPRVAIGDPAMLIAHRPDVRAAERRLAASSAAIGVSEARRLPQLSFRGLLGLGGRSAGDVLDIDRLTALAMPSLTWSFLDFGRGKAGVRQSEAKRDIAEADHRSTVLAALQDAETSLSRFGTARLRVANLARVEQAADRSANLNRQRLDSGTSTLIDQLDIEQQRASAAMALSEGKAALASSFVTVQKSLGLGWTDSSNE